MAIKKLNYEISNYLSPLKGAYYTDHGQRLADLLLNREPVELQREPKNKHHKNAIGVWYRPGDELADRLRLARGVRIRLGYVDRTIADALKGADILRGVVIRPTQPSTVVIKVVVSEKVRR